MIDEATLRRLMAGRWLVPVMALLDEGAGARFAEMIGRLGLARGTLSHSLTQLIDAGWVRRNSGHGHPLRPEYVLTSAGEPVGASCTRLMRQRRALGLAATDLSRWSLPIVARLDLGSARFSALKQPLDPITPRALSLALKQLVAADLICRRLEDRYPPVAIYALSSRGRDLARAMGRR